MTTIAIRADGDSGAEAGLGHVFRSLAYVEELVRRNPAIRPVFLMRDFHEGIVKVSREGHPVAQLPVRPSPEDYQSTLAAIRPELVIIDTLGSTPELMSACRAVARTLITLDDLTPSALDADVIVNGILWATAHVTAPAGGPKVYEGVDYLQLRPQFAEANRVPRAINSEVRELLISTGGADGRGFAAELAAAAAALPFDCHVNIMIGPAYNDLAALRRVADTAGRVSFTLVENADNMADYLTGADLAIFTAGTVMFEAAACGTPAVIVSSYENQVPQAEWFAARGVFPHLGYMAGGVEQQRVTEAVATLAADFPRRREMSCLGKLAVDGRGLERFVDIVSSALDGGLL